MFNNKLNARVAALEYDIRVLKSKRESDVFSKSQINSSTHSLVLQLQKELAASKAGKARLADRIKEMTEMQLATPTVSLEQYHQAVSKHLKSDAEVARLRALVASQKKIIVSLNRSLNIGLRGGEFYAF